MISRRAVLLAGVTAVAGAGAAEAVVRLRHHPDHTGLPDVPAGLQVSGEFASTQYPGPKRGWTIAYPRATAERLPVVVSLHGRGADHRTSFGDTLGLQRFLVAGKHDFAIASIDGGDTYWHRRAAGGDAGAMVISEFLPLLADHGLDTRRIGFLGWSMGGFGSLWLAGQLGAARVAAVTAESPAIWHRAGDTAAGAFDDPADFAAHDVFSHPDWVHDIPTRIDCGTSDGFCPAARSYAALVGATAGFQPGAHTLEYWRSRAPEQLSFLSHHFG